MQTVYEGKAMLYYIYKYVFSTRWSVKAMLIGKKSHTSIRKKYEQRSNAAVKIALDKIRQAELAPYVKHVYLYGSCARKEQTYESDVDLLLELDPSFESFADKTESIIELKKSISAIDSSLPQIELKIVIGDNWKKAKSLFFINVNREGVELW